MRIAVNTRLLLPDKLDGIGWFSFETLKRITQAHHEHQFYFIFDRPYNKAYIFSDNVTPVVAFPQTRRPFLNLIYFNWVFPRLLKRLKIDLLLSPDGILPYPCNVPSVNVIHDINFEHHPEYLPKQYARYYLKWYRRYAKAATRIATVSEYSKADIAKTYAIDVSTIDVVYNGANENYVPLSDEEKQKVRAKYTNGLPYFIFISSIHPRKNLENMLRAFYQFRKTVKKEVKFLIVGDVMWHSQALKTLLNEGGDALILFGRASVEELKDLLGSAEALLYVSYFEGFGIPILEAFYAGVPVITSDTTSMPEVAGKAALLASPNDVQAIAKQMQRIIEDHGLRQKLIEEGNLQKQKFSWDKTANLLWQSVEKVIQKIK
jgi:glycosyltransferase involved in cell wall biosynthesis